MFRRKIEENRWLLACLALWCALPGPNLRAGTVTVDDIAAMQALTTDLVAASVNSLSGFDAASQFTYGGTFSPSNWAGSLGGTYQGSSVSGSSDATISGDPGYTVMGGVSYMINSGKNKIDAQINFPLVQDNANPNKFTMTNGEFGGGLDKYTWSSMNLMKTTKGMTDIYDGTVMGMLTSGGKAGPQESWKVHFEVTPGAGDLGLAGITSTFTRTKGGPPVTYYDKGSVGYDPVAALGQMNQDVATVPEPSGLVLVGIIIFLSGTCWCLRHVRFPVQPFILSRGPSC